MYDLAGLLFHGAERDIGRRRDDAGFFAELALRGIEQVLAFVNDAFGNRPCAGVAARPERSAGMGEEDLERLVASSEEQKSRADGGTRAHSVERRSGGDHLVTLERKLERVTW